MATLRCLSPADIDQAMELSMAAHWNQLPEDWARLLALEPQGCFCLEEDGRVVASATVVEWDPDLAWLGMVLTLPAYRGRGFAKRLLAHAIGWSRARSLRLDATEMGLPLYETFGFRQEFPVERWLRQSASPASGHGVRREQRSGGSYAYGRPGRTAAQFGPCVAQNVEEARALADWFDRHFAGPSVWDLNPGNQEAVHLARTLGYVPFRRLMRMSRGPQCTLDPRVFAFAGFEYGEERLFKYEESLHEQGDCGAPSTGT